MTTPKLGLDEIAESQSNKYATHNEALRGIDALLPGVAISVRHSPPGSPANGDVYIISDGSPTATGDWAGQDGDIAWYNGAWNFVTPEEGFTLYNQGADEEWRFDGTSWAAVAGSGITLEDEGSTVAGGPHTTMNFTGSGVSVTNAGGGEATITISGGGGGSGIGSATGFKGASVYATSAQSLANGANHAIIFDSEYFDTNSYFAAGSPGHPTRLTVPETGYYWVRGFARLSGAGLTGRLQAYIRKNGSDNQTGLLVQDMGGESNLSISVSGLIQMDANDYVELIVSQTSGGSVNTLAGADAQYPRLELFKIETTTGAQSFSGASVYASSLQTIANNTTTAVQFNNQDYDTDDYWAEAGSPSDTFVIPEDGYYLVNSIITWDTNTTGYRRLYLQVNGTYVRIDRRAAAGSLQTSNEISDVRYYTSGSTIALHARQDSGGNLDIASTGDGSNARASVTRIASPGIVVSNEGAGSPTVDQTFSEIRIGAGLELEDLGSGVGRIKAGTTGTFTPTYEPANNSFTSITYETQDGRYLRIGEWVFCAVSIRTATLTVGSASGQLFVGGLPFTVVGAAEFYYGGAVTRCASWTSNAPNVVQANAGTDQFAMYSGAGGTGNTATTVSDMQAGTGNYNLMRCTFAYRTSD